MERHSDTDSKPGQDAANFIAMTIPYRATLAPMSTGTKSVPLAERQAVQREVERITRDEGFDLLHELAEWVCPLDATHPDVQAVTVALAVERSRVIRAVQAHGPASAPAALLRGQRWVTPWMVVAGVALYCPKKTDFIP